MLPSLTWPSFAYKLGEAAQNRCKRVLK